MDSQAKDGLIQKSKEIKQEIASLRKELNEINAQKESWFNKKEDIHKNVSNLIENIRNIKKTKDIFNKQVYEEKNKRDKYNQEVQKLVAEIKKLNKEKQEFFQKHGIKTDPGMVKEKIEQLDKSIETDALSFEKEKKVMDQIKKLKRVYDESAEANNLIERIDEMSKKIDETRKKADESHKKLMGLSKENKEGYSDFISASKEINSLKGNQEQAYNTFVDFKKKFFDTNAKLKENLLALHEIQDKIDEARKEVQKERQAEQQKRLEEKTKEVEEKLKTKKRLTTEDLIVLQSSNL